MEIVSERVIYRYPPTHFILDVGERLRTVPSVEAPVICLGVFHRTGFSEWMAVCRLIH